MDGNEFIPQPQTGGLDPKFSQWLETSEDVMQLLEHDWRGEVYDESAASNLDPWVKRGKPKMNETGIRFLIGFLRPISSRGVFMSYLGKDEIDDQCLRTLSTLAKSMCTNATKYELSAENFGSVMEQCSVVIEFAYRRAVGQGERKFLGSGIVSETIHQAPKRNVSGWTGIFNRGGNK